MSEELEALGAAATAGLAAAVLESPHADGNAKHAETHGTCANCGAALSGKYCAQCGQHVHIHRSLIHMVEELLHGIFHFDTKAWRTIPTLIFKPGTLTRNYIEGHRVRYVSPLALFLFMVFLSFFAASFTNSGDEEKPMSPAVKQAQLTDYLKQLDEARDVAAKANVALSEATKAGGNVDDAKENLEDAQMDVSEIEKSVKDLTAEVNAAKAASVKADADKANAGKGEATKVVVANTEVGKDKLQAVVADSASAYGEVVHSTNRTVEKVAANMRNKTFDTGSPTMDLAIKHALNNPELALYKLKNTVYKYSFMLVPISLPFMWLLFFWKRNVKMFDHAVFVLYSLCFMSLLFVAAVIVSIAGVKPEFAALAMLIPPVHIFAQLRGAYRLGALSALWRTLALVITAFIVLVLFALFVLVMSMH